MDLLKFVFLIGFLVTIGEAQEPCLTPLSRNGVCVPAEKCPSLVQLHNKYRGVWPQHMVKYMSYAKCSDVYEPIRFCCDDAESATLTMPVPELMLSDAPEGDQINNLDFLKQLNRKGFNLLNNTLCGIDNGDRIKNGVRVDPGQLPWMALLKFSGSSDHQFQCGGSLITDQYVLTAAHCVNGQETVIGVRLGENDLTTNPDCLPHNVCMDRVEDFGIEKIISHPYYSKTKHHNDIALIKLNRKVQNKISIRPICLPITPAARKLPADQKYIIAGWGLTEKGLKSKVLLQAEVKHLNSSICQQQFAYTKISRTKHLCVGDLVSGRDHCDGDSGGPVMQMSSYKKYKVAVQYGVIASGSFGCTRGQNLPAICTNIINYLPWITHSIVN